MMKTSDLVFSGFDAFYNTMGIQTFDHRRHKYMGNMLCYDGGREVARSDENIFSRCPGPPVEEPIRMSFLFFIGTF